MKGILLAGGKGSRLFPLTISTNKHLLPIFDKPMIYYSLSVLMLSNIREISLITAPESVNAFKNLLGNGDQFGIKLQYLIQDQPLGIAECFLIAEDFIGNDPVSLILGDNIFFGYNFSDQLIQASEKNQGATIFSSFVSNPSEFAVAEFDDGGNVISLEEKPKSPKSHYAVTGLYFYDNEVVSIAKSLSPSGRGELEITDINKIYLKHKKLKNIILGRGFAWLDTGNANSLIAAGNFVRTVEKRQGLKIACLEEIAFHKGWITKEIVLNNISRYGNTSYASYLKRIIQ